MQTKNPLQLTSYVFAFIFVVYLLLLIPQFVYDSVSAESFFSKNIVKILGLCFCCVFFINYFKKYIFAWWIAVFFFPAVFLASIIAKNITIDNGHILSMFIVSAISFFYLFSKYDLYNNYLKALKDKSKEDKSDAEEEFSGLNRNSNLHKSENPLQILFYALIISAIVALFNVFAGGGGFARKFGSLTAYSHQAITLFLILFFVLSYHKKSIWAWWIALIGGPIYWMIFYAFLPIGIPLIIITIAVNAIAIGYLVSRYRSYKDYIMKQTCPTQKPT